MTIFKISKYIHLDKFNGCYEKILIINKDPKDSQLKPYLKTLRREKVSPFKFNNCCSNEPHCIKAFINPSTNKFLDIENIDVLFTLLTDNQYKIEYEMTKMINKNNSNKDLVCYISKSK
tara:strand:- start:95 stop:451 length:357 start_codon:yes stop_codon:yes gene_type:complete